RPRRRDARRRRRADESRGLRAPRAREGAAAGPLRLRARVRRVLPVLRRPRARDHAGRHGDRPAGRLAARRRGHRGGGEGGRRDGLHGTPALPPLMAGVERHGSGGPYEQIVGYSRVIRAGDLVVVAGSTALTPDGVIAGIGDPYLQTRQTIENIAAALERVGATLADVIRTRVFLVAHR